MDNNQITCYTEHKCNGTIYHAHPSYRLTNEWHDCAMVKFIHEDKATYETMPCKISCFISHPVNIAIIQCADQINDNMWEDDMYPIVERRKLNQQYLMVDTSHIHDTCYVIPDIGNDGGNEYILIHPMEKWGDEFLKLSFK